MRPSNKLLPLRTHCRPLQVSNHIRQQPHTNAALNKLHGRHRRCTAAPATITAQVPTCCRGCCCCSGPHLLLLLLLPVREHPTECLLQPPESFRPPHCAAAAVVLRPRPAAVAAAGKAPCSAPASAAMLHCPSAQTRCAAGRQCMTPGQPHHLTLQTQQSCQPAESIKVKTGQPW